MRWFAIKDYPLNNDADYINLALHNENAKYCYGDDGYHSTFFLVLLFVMVLSNEIWVFVSHVGCFTTFSVAFSDCSL